MSEISALGLDVGSKRIGVAGCDRTGLIAAGLTTSERSSFDRDIEQLRHWVDERQVQVLVVGLPYTMEGKLGFRRARYRNLLLELQMPSSCR